MREKWKIREKAVGEPITTATEKSTRVYLLTIKSMDMADTTFCQGLNMREIGAAA